MAKAPTIFSLASLNSAKASEVPFEFPFLDADGDETGVFFSVIGGQSPAVVAETQRLLNDRRKRDALAVIRAKTGGRKEQVVFTPVEEDLDFAHRMAAVRLVGWRGIEEPFAPDLALQLVQTNGDALSQIVDQSDKMGRFTSASPKPS